MPCSGRSVGVRWLGLGLALAGCAPGEPVNPWLDLEATYASAYDEAPIAVQGRVLSDSGAPVSGATVTLADLEARTDADGVYRFPEAPRHNAVLTVTASGFRDHVQPTWLVHPLDQSTREQPTVFLADKSGTRFLWTGDFMIGRRFLDPDETAARDALPAPNADALVSINEPATGSLATVSFIQPLFETADFPIVNLESVVTDLPDTPHVTKDFVYFTLPGSLVALTELGVQYVNLGNNHVYDYLEPGLLDTLDHLDSAGLGYSGAGVTVEDALAPWRIELDGQTYALLGANSITGDEHDVSYVAELDKGGAASLDDLDLLIEQIEAEVDAGHVPLVQIHSGYEYTYFPSAYTRSVYEAVADAGAALVVGNHTHVSQGMGWTDADVLALHCLGNFVFDQTRSDTMLGLLAEVQQDGFAMTRTQLVPVYLEDYRPRMITGPLSARFLRRVAESSDNADELAVYGDRLHLQSDAVLRTRDSDVVLTVTVPDSGEVVVDLRDHLPATASVSALEMPGVDSLRIGRDLLVFGTFEDNDVDPDRREAARWDLSGTSRAVCFLGARSGVQGLCSYRSEDNIDDSIAAFRNRVRVWGDGLHVPNKDVSLFGYVSGEGAGPVTAVVRYMASVGENEFGEESFALSGGGTFDWTPFVHDLTIPPDTNDPEDEENNPRAMRLFLRHGPSAEGWGRASFDDLALVSWEESLEASGDTLSTPHPRDFLRVQAAPGTYILSLTFVEHVDQTAR